MERAIKRLVYRFHERWEKKKVSLSDKNTLRKKMKCNKEMSKWSYRKNHQNHGDGSEMSPESQQFSATVHFKNHFQEIPPEETIFKS